MHSCDSTPTEPHASDAATGLAKSLAPEEIRAGDYVAPLHMIYEFAPFMWCDDSALAPSEEPLRMRFVPGDEPTPLKVLAVCLPFVLTKKPCGGSAALDVRRYRLARLDAEYARKAWKVCSAQRSTKRRRRKRK